MVVGVLGNQIVGPHFVRGQHEFTSVDHIPQCLCGVGGGGGGGSAEPYLANSSDVSSMPLNPFQRLVFG